jgi:hypothetical protein
LSISKIDLVILFYFCKLPAVLLSIQCLTNYNFVVHVPAVAIVTLIIDNRVLRFTLDKSVIISSWQNLERTCSVYPSHNWLLVKQSDKLEYRCKWFENMMVITANNNTIKDHMKLKRHQWGGTSLVTRGKLVHNIGKKGVDEAGLERWWLMEFVGKRNKSTRIISAYTPHQPT